MPIKIPASFSPENHKISEKIKDKNAATNIRMSTVVNFLNIIRISCNLSLLVRIERINDTYFPWNCLNM